MLSKKGHSSKSSSSSLRSMLPPPDPIQTDFAPTMDLDMNSFESLIQMPYLTPELPTADSAVHNFNSSVTASANWASGRVGPTSVNGSADSIPSDTAQDIENFSLWLSPFTSFQTNLPTPQPPTTPVSAGPPSTQFASPALFNSPFTDVLNTPAVESHQSFRSPDIVSASPAQNLNLIDDVDFTGQSLFDLLTFMNKGNGHSTTTTSASATTSVLHVSDSMSTVSPTDLGLGLSTVTDPISGHHQSWERDGSAGSSALSSLSPPSRASHHISSPPSAASTSSASRRTHPTTSTTAQQRNHNGVRKDIAVKDLIPIDAPIQPRNYITPSATSRKDVPPSVAKTFVPNSRKRSASAAGLPTAEEMLDELADEDPENAELARRRREMDPEKAALLEHVEQARRRNTLAARKSRQRKLEHVRGLEELVERLQMENEELKSTLDERTNENEELRRKVEELEKELELQRMKERRVNDEDEDEVGVGGGLGGVPSLF